MYDIEVYADRFEQEEAHRLECNAELALENGAAHAVLCDLEQAARDLLERMDKHLEAVHALRLSMNTPASWTERHLPGLSAEQTEEETALFTEWLS